MFGMLHDIILVSIPTRLFLHDDVHEGLSDVRRKAVEDMKKLREKSGTLKGLVRLLDLLLLTQTQSILFRSRFVFRKPDINLQVLWRGSESLNKFPEIFQTSSGHFDFGNAPGRFVFLLNMGKKTPVFFTVRMLPLQSLLAFCSLMRSMRLVIYRAYHCQGEASDRTVT